jgi:zinc protease
VLGQIKKLKDVVVSEKELQRVKAQMIASKIYERDSVFYQAMKLGLLETTLNDWRLSENHTDRLQAVTAEQIRFVARKYFKPENMTVAVLDPQPIATDKSTNKTVSNTPSKEQKNAN